MKKQHTFKISYKQGLNWFSTTATGAQDLLNVLAWIPVAKPQIKRIS